MKSCLCSKNRTPKSANIRWYRREENRWGGCERPRVVDAARSISAAGLTRALRSIASTIEIGRGGGRRGETPEIPREAPVRRSARQSRARELPATRGPAIILTAGTIRPLFAVPTPAHAPCTQRGLFRNTFALSSAPATYRDSRCWRTRDASLRRPSRSRIPLVEIGSGSQRAEKKTRFATIVDCSLFYHVFTFLLVFSEPRGNVKPSRDSDTDGRVTGETREAHPHLACIDNG